jgi:RNA polymerase sigma-70 factor (ECF subfamily)
MLPTVEETQAQLLSRIATGDRDAVGEFYDQTAGALFSVALRILNDTQEAEEVIQDVFVQIWEKAATFDSAIGVPFHWVMSITRNRSIDRLRSRQRRARVMTTWEDAGELDLPVESASGRAPLAEDEQGAIRSAVVHLPKDQRQAIEMAFFGGMTHPEIAEALNEPLGTIKARIRRGMMKLKDSLQAYV